MGCCCDRGYGVGGFVDEIKRFGKRIERAWRDPIDTIRRGDYLGTHKETYGYAGAAIAVGLGQPWLAPPLIEAQNYYNQKDQREALAKQQAKMDEEYAKALAEYQNKLSVQTGVPVGVPGVGGMSPLLLVGALGIAGIAVFAVARRK